MVPRESPVETTTSHPKRIAGVYRLGRRIGVGAMGQVFAARHEITGSEVALKLIHPHVAETSLNLTRFEREVSVGARVGHDGIVKVFDAGIDEAEGAPYVAMELLHGESLEARLRRPNTSVADLVRYLIEVCDPLAAAHRQGIVHRDLKPDNVFIHRRPSGQEQVKLLDFGIARDLAQKGLTATNVGLGTPHYMAPEQATDARGVTQAADVWAVGILLYRYIRGVLPFDGEGPFDTVFRALTENHDPISEREAPAELIEIVECCLRKDPEARLGDAGVLRERLGALLDDPDLALALAALELPGPAPRSAKLLLASPTSPDGAIGGAARDLLKRAREAARHGGGPQQEPNAALDPERSETEPKRPIAAPPPRSHRRPLLLSLVGLFALSTIGLGLTQMDLSASARVEALENADGEPPPPPLGTVDPPPLRTSRLQLERASDGASDARSEAPVMPEPPEHAVGPSLKKQDRPARRPSADVQKKPRPARKNARGPARKKARAEAVDLAASPPQGVKEKTDHRPTSEANASSYASMMEVASPAPPRPVPTPASLELPKRKRAEEAKGAAEPRASLKKPSGGPGNVVKPKDDSRSRPEPRPAKSESPAEAQKRPSASDFLTF